jgi:hypothetical protein
MRQYISSYDYGNIFPLIKDIYFLSNRGSLFPTKDINMNTYKEIACYGSLALENARFGYGLAAFAKDIFYPSNNKSLVFMLPKLCSLLPMSPIGSLMKKNSKNYE